MIENTLLHFKTKAAFNTELEAGNIKDDSITFVQDSKEIITHGESYKSVSWHKAGTVSNGVYAVSAKGELIDYKTADATAIGVALVAGEHKFMIAKSDAADGSNPTLYWGKNLYGKDVAGITETTDNSVAKADFGGKANTDAIAAAYGQHSVDMDSRDMCKVLATYAEGGFTDWYVPACGQLYEVYTKKSDINTALQNIGGTAFESSDYWSSSESVSRAAWRVDFDYGNVYDGNKRNDSRVRFVRDIEITTPVNSTFVHYPEKSQFTTQLESGNIPNETIVFIDDTKEIWTHGTYFDGSAVDLSNIEQSVQYILNTLDTKIDKTAVISIEQGGTGATTKDEACENIGAVKKYDLIQTLSKEGWYRIGLLKVIGSTSSARIIIGGTNADVSPIIMDFQHNFRGNMLYQMPTVMTPLYITKVRAARQTSDDVYIDLYFTNVSSSRTTARVIPYEGTFEPINFIDVTNETVTVLTSIDVVKDGFLNDRATTSEVDTKLTGKIGTNGTVTSVIAMTQSEYDALITKDPTTLYIITES